MTSESDLPKWMTGKAGKKRQNSRSAKHEKELATRSGGRVRSGSGNTWKAPRDVSTRTHLIEHKFSDKGSYRVSAALCRAILTDGLRAGKYPLLIVDLDKEGLRLTIHIEDTSRG